MFMIKKIYDMFLPANKKTLDLASSSYYLGLSSIVLFIFLFPFSNAYLLNCEDEAANNVRQVFEMLSVDLCDDDHEAESEAVDSEDASEQEASTQKGDVAQFKWIKPPPSQQEELLTEENELCFEENAHLDSTFEERVRIQQQDGSYTYEYEVNYEYNYRYRYRYNADKCIGPLPYPPNQPPPPHDGNPYPAPTP